MTPSALIKAADLQKIFGVSFTLYAHHVTPGFGETFAYHSNDGWKTDIKILVNSGRKAFEGWIRGKDNISYTVEPRIHSSARIRQASLSEVMVCVACGKAATAKLVYIELRPAGSATEQLVMTAKLAAERLN